MTLLPFIPHGFISSLRSLLLSLYRYYPMDCVRKTERQTEVPGVRIC